MFDGQHGFTDDLRSVRSIPWRVSAVCPVRRLTMMRWSVLIADSGLSLDVLDKRAREVYDCGYSTTYQRYQTAIVMLIDDLLGVD